MSEPRRSKAYLVFFLLSALVLALYGIAGVPLRQARTLWRQGRVAEAAQLLDQWRRVGVRPADYLEARAVMHLTVGERRAAERLLARVRPLDRSSRPPIPTGEVAERLLALGRYDELLVYLAVVDTAREYDFHRAAAMVGAGRVAEGAALLPRVPRSNVQPQRIAVLERAIAERRSGSEPLLFDRNGVVVARFERRSNDIVASPHFAPLIDRSGGALSIEAQQSVRGGAMVETTLDAALQSAAVEALGDHRGSLVAIDVASGEIVAVANTTVENFAFSGRYEPGSVMKVVTLLAALESKVAVGKLFPFHCDGTLEIDGRQFHDWARHDRLATVDEALATSCNLAFGRIGIDTGARALESFWQKFGFGSNLDLGLVRVPLGRQVAPLAPDFALAEAACGLQLARVNTLQLAIVASAIADGGEVRTAPLLRARRSILGDRIQVNANRPSEPQMIASRASVDAVRKSMRAVVTDPRGTGRRAAESGVAIAMKTGTAGERDPAYDALAIAYAPAERPRLAIGVIVENGGPAQLAATMIARDFFERAFNQQE